MKNNLLTQRALAKLIGVTNDTVWLIVHEKTTPTYKTQAKFETLKKTYEKEAKRV